MLPFNTKKTNPNIINLAVMLAAFAAAVPASALTGATWKKYFGLTPEQKPAFDQANKDKAEKVKALKAQEEGGIQDLRGQVDAKASDDQIKGTFSRLRAATQAIHAAEDGFWSQAARILTPTQQAKLLLKSHPPKNPPGLASRPAASGTPSPIPGDSAVSASGKTPAQEWKVYFALTPTQKQPFDDANQTKRQSLKQEHEDAEKAIEELSRKVGAQASDAEIAPAFAAARRALAAPVRTEEIFWDEVAGILTPTQQAKLYLKGKPLRK